MLHSMGLQRVGHDRVTEHTHTHTHTVIQSKIFLRSTQIKRGSFEKTTEGLAVVSA